MSAAIKCSATEVYFVNRLFGRQLTGKVNKASGTRLAIEYRSGAMNDFGTLQKIRIG